MNNRILAMLVCPVAKCQLQYDKEAQELISYPMKLAYPVNNGIPILLEAEARIIEES
jgi:uncharacterized protein YbaR (Trm112 family)